MYDEHQPIKLIFDNNEPYLHFVKEIRQRKKHGVWWRGKVSEPIPSSIYEAEPLQAADLIAGFVNRYMFTGGFPNGELTDLWGMKAVFVSTMVPNMIPAYYGERELLNIFNRDGSYNKGAKSPVIPFKLRCSDGTSS